MPCVFSNDNSLLEDFNVSKNSIMLFKDFDEEKNVYQGDWDPKDIKKFVKANSVPSVSEFHQKLASLIFTDSNPGLFLLRSNKDKDLDRILFKVAPDIKNDLYVTYSQIAVELGKRLSDFISIKEDELPSV